MKSLILTLLSFPLISSAYAFEEAQIYSIDYDDTAINYVEASEEALPRNYSKELLSFTPITSARASELFLMLKNDRRARMSHPSGACSTRRAYIQKVLRNKNIRSGKFYISCPGNNGRLRLRDQVSGRYFTYSNFHDTNVVLVESSYRIMDVQFESSHVSLSSYLAQIEAFQRIQPAKELDAGVCYWRISSPSLTREFGGNLNFAP